MKHNGLLQNVRRVSRAALATGALLGLCSFLLGRPPTETASKQAATPQAKSIVRLRAARALVREKQWDAAHAEFAKVVSMPDAPAHHRLEAEECQREIERTGEIPTPSGDWSRVSDATLPDLDTPSSDLELDVM